MAAVRVAELDTEAEWEAAYPVLMELWADADRVFTREEFLAFLRELRAVEGYRLFGLFADDALVSVAGVSVRMSVWYGRYLWVYDLATAPNHRSNGFGERLLSHLERWAADRGCDTIGLASAPERTDAHRFYEDRGMERSSHVFTRSLDS
ncbi:GNAT family N-acetyltransferase [Halobacterium wangiae]|uniref:GNAT family N-acetyltransferase n=1 Tax=Halobacterium wangiae TaxID=2902623 RepID=UPI001E54D73D|nr:GNAT family N-acetyltransferase [Halobacterium wangiae]